MHFSINSSVSKKPSKSTRSLTNIFNDDDVSDENISVTDAKKFPQSVQWFTAEETTLMGTNDAFTKTEFPENETDKGDDNENCNIISMDKDTKTSDSFSEEKVVRMHSNRDKNVKTSGLIYSSLLEKRKKETERREPRYIQNLLRNATRREMELEIVQERQLKRGSNESKDNNEIFVTGAYKKRLEERKKFEQELMLQDLKDAVNDPCKKKDLTSFYQYMLSSGLAARTKNDQGFKPTT